MGFLQARLQERYGPLKASVIVTLPFALYHLPALLVEGGLTLAQLPLTLVLLGILAISQMFGRIVLMWLYNNTTRSVLLVGLFHSSFDATTSRAGFAGEFIPGGTAAAFFIPSGLLAVAAVLIVVFTKGRLSYKPESAPQPTTATPLQ